MKLIGCVFLIVVILEEYHCAPYFGTTGRHKHHHHLRPSRPLSSNRCRPYCSLRVYNSRFGHGTQYYHPMYDLPYGSRYRSRPCTWHGSRYCKGYGSHYGTRPFIPNLTPIYKPVDKTVEKPVTVDKSMIVDKPVSVAILEEKPVTADKPKTMENPVTMPLDEPVDKPVTVANLTDVPITKPQDMSAGDSVDKTVYNSQYHPMYDLKYGSQHGSRPCAWHQRHGSQYCKGYGSRYVKIPFNANNTPIYNPVHKTVRKPVTKVAIEDKSLAVDRPKTIDNVVEKPERKPVTDHKLVTMEDPVMVPLDKPVEKFVEKPVTVDKSMIVNKSIAIEKLVEKPERKPVTEDNLVIVEDPVMVSLAKPVEKLVDKPVTVDQTIIVNKSVAVKKPTTIDKLVEKNERKPVTEDKVVTLEDPVMVSLDKPVEKLVEKPVTVDQSMIVNKSVAVEKPTTLDKLVVQPERKPVTGLKIVTMENRVTMPKDKPIDKKSVDKLVSVANLTDVPANEPQHMPTDDSVDRTVYTSVAKPLVKSIVKPSGNISENPLHIPSINSAESSENLSDYATVNPFDDLPSENLFGMSTENPFIVTNILP